jgi:hypothetical protein
MESNGPTYQSTSNTLLVTIDQDFFSRYFIKFPLMLYK